MADCGRVVIPKAIGDARKRGVKRGAICYFGPIRCGDMTVEGFVWGECADGMIELRQYSNPGNEPTCVFIAEDKLRTFTSYKPNPDGTLVRRAMILSRSGAG